MDRIEFYVQGSEDEPYRVVIEKDGENLNAYCNCAAGMNGQYCKHRFRILSGNPENLVGDNQHQLGTAVDWLVGTDVEAALSVVARAEDEFEIAKKVLADAKKRLASALRR